MAKEKHGKWLDVSIWMPKPDAYVPPEGEQK